MTTPATPPAATTPSLPAGAVSAIFNATLRLGMHGKDVTRLQELLAEDASVYPQGLVTGYFGPLTERAVELFQAKYGIVSSGTPWTTGYGLVGPKTRTKLAEIFGSAAGAAGAASQPVVQPQASSTTTAELQAKIRSLQEEVVQLLQQLLQLQKSKANGG